MVLAALELISPLYIIMLTTRSTSLMVSQMTSFHSYIESAVTFMVNFDSEKLTLQLYA